MAEIRFTDAHEYVLVEGDIAVVGITEYAQEQLGDIVFVELPEVGRAVKKGDEAAVVESVKAAAEVYAPVAGEVLETNRELEKNPALVNEDPEGRAWFLKIKMANADELNQLMDREAYAKFLETLD